MGKIIDNPHARDISDVLENLSAGKEGLITEEAKERLFEYGPNKLPESKGPPLFNLILKQFKSWLVIILIVAAIISFIANQIIDMWVIIAVILINGAIGFIQEYRAEKALESLQKMIVKTAKVLRDGELITINSEELVPGDVIVLEEGDSIAADARIIQCKNFRTIEASLTGESIPGTKTEEAMPVDTPLADRENMVWKSTFVAGGYAHAVVTGTGPDTAIGDISTSLEAIKVPQTTFMKKTAVLARQMAIIAVISAAVIFFVGYFLRQFEIREILLISIAALVAAVPEGLPAVISIVLAIGANRMAKRNAIIREFTATETLGAVTAILTDKTGTLTENILNVRNIFMPGEKEITVSGKGWFPAGNFFQNDTIIEPLHRKNLTQLLRIAAISNNAEIRHDKEKDTYELIGDPTEGALAVMARKGGLNMAELKQDKIEDFPFDSQVKMRATLARHNGKKELYVTGAPEKLLERANRIHISDGIKTLGKVHRKAIEDKIAEWSDHAMRVIALAYKEGDATMKTQDVEAMDELIFTGIVGMIDPPRADVLEAVKKCRKAGIRVIMVTGDHVNTAVAIAKSTGIIPEDQHEETMALTEQQLEHLDEDEFDEAIKTTSVFARLTPKMKLRIANRMQEMGHLIAMTGDGVNDAPALKQANVGISMGLMGTDVARETSDVVLADDNFASIVNAVEEGRIVFNNSRKTSFFLVTTNIAESVTIITAIAIGLPVPLLATQILWLNLVTDSFPAIALANEQKHGSIHETAAPKRNENILNREVVPFLIINVIIMALLSLGTFYYYMDNILSQARTGVFLIMAFTQLFNVYNLRTLHRSVFKVGFFSNKYINMGVGVSILLLILVTEIPVIADILHFHSLPLLDFIILFLISSLVLWASEIYKFFSKKEWA